MPEKYPLLRTGMEQRITRFAPALLFLLSLLLYGSAFAQEQSVSLDGTWHFQPVGLAESTNEVPGFYVWNLSAAYVTFPNNENGPWRVVEGYPDADYWRSFNVPSSMAGQRIFLRFESVNYVTDIYINGELAGSHSGGYVPFEIDITNFVNVPSTNNIVTVSIRYNTYRFLEYQVYPRWPTGYYGHAFNLGITGSVALISRSPVYCSDVHIKTLVQDSRLWVTLTIVNKTNEQRSIRVKSWIPSLGLIIGDAPVQVDSMGSVSVTYEKPAGTLQRWTPQNPALYTHRTELFENGLVYEREDRFGFREFKVSGDHFTLNGVKINLRGDNIIIHSETPHFMYYMVNKPDWISIVDSLLALNINVIRLHQQPAPAWMLDICDEKGMMVIAESAIYGIMFPRSPEYVKNAKIWLKEWIIRDRNHPSIMIWSAENEMLAPQQSVLIPSQLADLDTAIKSVDDTRPVMYSCAGDVNGLTEITSWHYTFGFPNGWPASGGIYTFLNKWETALANFNMPFDPNTAMSSGEFEWSGNLLTESEHVRRQAVKVRAMRYLGFDDIRPYRLDWMWLPVPLTMGPYNSWSPSPQEITFMKNSLDPLLAFDKHYHEFHWMPSPPQFGEGETVTRTIIVFNDCPAGTDVELRWKTTLNGVVNETGSRRLTIALGETVETDIQFQAPYSGSDQLFQLHLTTWKDGNQQCEEVLNYKTLNQGSARPSRVTGISGDLNNDVLGLNWTPVTDNEEGGTVSIAGYRVERSSRVDFAPASTTSFSVPGNAYTETVGSLIGDAGDHLFYRMYAIDQGGIISRSSDVYGIVTYGLTATATTDINEIGLPVVMPQVSSASALAGAFQQVDAVFRWDNAGQGVVQYIPGVPATDFPLTYGTPVIVNSTGSGTLTMHGMLASVAYALTTTPTTSFNAVMLPLQRNDLTTASLLMADIPNCNGVALWNSVLQGFEQYIPEIPATDFSTVGGGCYYVNVSSSVGWNAAATAAAARLKPDTDEDQSSVAASVPHAVWGDAAGLPEGSFRACITNRPGDVLTPDDPGCFLTGEYWLVQCGNFSGPWHPKDTLRVTFFDDQGQPTRESLTVLSANPVDRGASVTAVDDRQGPAGMMLYPNFPDPFNGSTTLQYSLPVRTSVRITIHDIGGRVVNRLLHAQQEAGMHSIAWNGRYENGREAASGIYLARIEAGMLLKTEKMVLTR
ncbi:T9SS type A sorting domain-containing protein [bacterium]|nr:T9SS type A sorting domain-containing protein [bacterium]